MPHTILLSPPPPPTPPRPFYPLSSLALPIPSHPHPLSQNNTEHTSVAEWGCAAVLSMAGHEHNRAKLGSAGVCAALISCMNAQRCVGWNEKEWWSGSFFIVSSMLVRLTS
jgi:hypothetical protein